MKPQQGDTKNICVYTLHTTLTMREVFRCHDNTLKKFFSLSQWCPYG